MTPQTLIIVKFTLKLDTLDKKTFHILYLIALDCIKICFVIIGRPLAPLFVYTEELFRVPDQ